MRDSESGEQWLGCPEPRVAPVLTKGMLATRGVVQTDLLIGGAPLPQKLVSVLCSEPVACPLQCAFGGPLPTPLLPRLPRGRAVGPVWARVSCADRLIRAVPKGACVGGVCGRPGGHTSRRGPRVSQGWGSPGLTRTELSEDHERKHTWRGPSPTTEEINELVAACSLRVGAEASLGEAGALLAPRVLRAVSFL